MSLVQITHFSDVLCVWAYVSEIRCDELLDTFSQQVSLEPHFFHVFGGVQRKLDRQWAERGGVAGYSAHVKSVVEGFDHANVHPEVWIRNTPESSLPAHLLLCAVRLLEERESIRAGSLRRTAWSVREAFFLHCADISKRGVLLELAEEGGLPVSALEDALGDGSAHAELCEDLEQARDQNIRSSPTLVFNEGRQQLTGNVGYRIIEANVRELLEHPPDQHSWC